MTRFAMLPPILAILCLGGCRPAADVRGGEKPTVVATVPMIADLAREIAGENATVETLLKEGVDPHTYAPTAADVRRLTAADVVLFNGWHLEGVMQDHLRNLSNSMAVAERIPADLLRHPPDFGTRPDPHVWMDVSLWQRVVPGIVEALVQLRPAYEEEFRANAERLTTRLEKLDEYVRSVVSTIPKERRRLITAHDAFGYFADAYDIEVFAVQGVSTESEAGVEDVNRLVELIVANEIPTVFMETNVSDRLLKSVIRGAEERGRSVKAGGPLYSDSTGPPGTWEATYFGMIDHNVGDIVRNLGGSVPEGGFRAWEAGRDGRADATEASPTE